MRILIDADACPVVRITEQVAKEKGIPVTLLCDTNHVLQSDYSEVITVGAGADAVDFKLVSICQKGDLVVTQDYGVAAMILGKGAYGIHQSGKWYTNENIDQMLMERHMAKKARNEKKKHHLKGPAKRTAEDDKHFEDSLRRLIDSIKVNKVYQEKPVAVCREICGWQQVFCFFQHLPELSRQKVLRKIERFRDGTGLERRRT